MAKWGEGDPRWIVEERPDATNVNNWHWTERNASAWSQDRLKATLEGHRLQLTAGDVLVKEVEKCEGEASANNRKGKLIFFYEWNLTLKWEASLKGGTQAGKINIPNLSEENDISEVEIEVTINEFDDDSYKLKEALLKQGKAQIREILADYVKALQLEFSKGMILPKKDEKIKPDHIKNLSSGFNKKINMQPVVSASKATEVKIETTTLNATEKFQCRANEFYDAMTRVELVMAFTRSEVKMEAKKGGEFVLFGGNIMGTFVELQPAKRIVQRWRYKQWPAGHYSTVEIDINEKSDHTEVSLKQVGVPTSDLETTKLNWERYYWTSIKQTFGFGAFLP